VDDAFNALSERIIAANQTGLALATMKT